MLLEYLNMTSWCILASLWEQQLAITHFLSQYIFRVDRVMMNVSLIAIQMHPKGLEDFKDTINMLLWFA